MKLSQWCDWNALSCEKVFFSLLAICANIKDQHGAGCPGVKLSGQSFSRQERIGRPERGRSLGEVTGNLYLCVGMLSLKGDNLN